ncbi:MAG: cadherin-like beta sandwich domain-containing protein, partial [Spirochaetota bacterium]|nr:cadherin-like beta sandwich domain-containing protein [Spirochaetota bacterium]
MNICVQKIPLLFIACMLIACACSSAEEVILSGIDTDVRLSKLVISDSDDPNSPDLDMIPVFDPQQTRYSASEVAQSVFITAACFNPNAKLYINGQEVPQDRMYEVPLLVDTNPIKIDVRVSKGSYTGTKTYTLDFTRVSDNNSSLIGIFPSIGTLDKAFYYGTFDYAISVPFSATSISLTAIAAGGKTVGIRYMLGAALVDSQNIDLTAGGTALYEGNTTVISIHTAARGENSSSIYTVSVTRAVPRTGNAILSFTFENLPSEQERLVCKIDDPIKLITGRMVYLTNADNTRYDGRPNRLPVIEVSPGARISTNASVAQDFTSDVLYTVTAENGVSVTYTVRIASSSPYPIIALLYTTASGTRNILNGEEIDIGNATRGETKSFAVTLSNAGYVDLELSNCTIAAEGGWGIATPLGQITTNLAPKAVRAVMMNLNPTEFEGIGTVLTLTSDNPEVPDFSVDISAYVYDTVVNNLLISEWAQTYGSGNAECYIELRNYSD